jgi:hypothetical protein
MKTPLCLAVAAAAILILFLFAPECAAATAPRLKYVFNGIEGSVVVLVEVRTPVPKKLGEYTSTARQFNLSRHVSGTTFYKDDGNLVKAKAFLEGLFAKNRPFTIGVDPNPPPNRPSAPSGEVPRSYSKLERIGGSIGEGNPGTVLFGSGRNVKSIDTLFRDWLDAQGIK